MEHFASHPEHAEYSSLMETVRAGLESERGGRLATVAAAALLALVTTGFREAPLTNDVPKHPVFGAHVPGIGRGEFPSTPIASVRLWDTGTSWRELEPKRGQWDFSVLDKAVQTAEKNGADVTLVLGQTPPDAAKYPNQPDNIYAKGASSPVEDMSRWEAYINKVVARYEGRINYYEVWNEINLDSFYTGSVAHMVRLTRTASEIIRDKDPAAKILSPSVLLRSDGPRKAMKDFIDAGGLEYVDIISVHGYPKPNGTPEDGADMIRAFKDSLPKQYAGLPIWDTEINYGLPWGGDGEAVDISPQDQAAYVERTLLLQADAGVERVMWYSWFPNKAPFLGVTMTNPTTGLKSEAAKAFGAINKLMDGGEFSGCETGDYGGISCIVDYPGGSKITVRWHPSKSIKVTVPDGTTAVVDATGNKINANVGDILNVEGQPVIIRTATKTVATS